MISRERFGIVAKLIETFGFRSGLSIYSKRVTQRLRSDSARWQPTEVTIGQSLHPIGLRIGTSDWEVFWQVFVDDEYRQPSQPHAQQLQRYYESILAQSCTPAIIDCGANIGLASIWYATQFPKAIIVAVEPQADNFALLTKNAARFDNIHCINAGISDQRGRLDMANDGDEPWTWTTSHNETGSIDATTIDDCLATVKDAMSLVVKVDIEGFETELFRSNTSWTQKTPLIVAETHDWLLPWQSTGHIVYSALTREGPRDYLHRGENVFCYSKALLQNA
jgi:FkbM family methyltransferase